MTRDGVARDGVAGVVFVNPHAGDDDGHGPLREAFAGFELRTCDPDALADAVCTALDQGARLIGVAGGDGTINTVAGGLASGDVPLLVVPGGTRNHFAKALGLDTVEAAADAARTGRDRRVDLGEVGDRVFVNNASIGLYPRLVRRRERHERRLSKGVGNVVAAWEQLRRGRKFDVEVDDTPHRAWAVFAGNGCYGDSLADLMERTSLDEGVLDVRIVRALGRWSRLRVVLALLTGRLARSPLVERIVTTQVRIDVGRPTVDVAVDGEVCHLDAPIVVRSRPGDLVVRVAG